MSEKEQCGVSGQGLGDGGNVVAFAPRKRIEPEEPFFTNEERAELRQMLREFKLVKETCPMARRILDPG